jgi:hypothetical protein
VGDLKYERFVGYTGSVFIDYVIGATRLFRFLFWLGDSPHGREPCTPAPDS